MYTVRLEDAISGDAVSPDSQQMAFTADALDQRELSIPDSTTDQEIVISIDVTAVKVFRIKSDQDVTIETNDPGPDPVPGNTLALVADQPYTWHEDALDAFKLTVDVTKLYVTNASGAAATVKILVLQDSTPE